MIILHYNDEGKMDVLVHSRNTNFLGDWGDSNGSDERSHLFSIR